MWRVYYFYPKDFTFICPTEIVAMDKLQEVMEGDNIKEDDFTSVFGISPDNEFCKIAWRKSEPMLKSLNQSLVADCGNKLAEELGIVDEDEGVPYRATYIVDKHGIIQHVSVNSLDTGRNAEETLRTLRAIQSGGLTGCAWQPGDDFVA